MQAPLRSSEAPGEPFKRRVLAERHGYHGGIPLIFQFNFDSESLSFSTVRVRAKILWSSTPVRLKPAIQVDVVKGSGYEEKILIRNAELIEDQKAYQFFVDLKPSSFSLPEYRSLILEKKPLPLLITLYPDLAMPIPTAGVPLPSVSPAIADEVSIAIPPTEIGQIEAAAELDTSPGSAQVRIKARVFIPELIGERREIERKSTAACEFVPGAIGLVVSGSTMIGEWKEALLKPRETLEPGKEVVIPVTVRTEVGGIILERPVSVTLRPVRNLELSVSRGYLRPKGKTPEPLTVRVHEVLDDGSRVLAEDADISLRPADDRVLTVRPPEGKGEVTSEVTIAGSTAQRSTMLLIEARVPEGRLDQQIPVELADDTLTLVLDSIGDRKVTMPPGEIPLLWDPTACQWLVPPLSFRLYREGAERSPEPIESLQISDANNWLVLSRFEKDSDGGCRVEITVEREKYGEIVPDLMDTPVFLSVESIPDEAPPSREITTQITAIALSPESGPGSEGLDASRGALSAAGMVPGGIPPATLSGSKATSLHLKGRVEPPEISLKVHQNTPVRLSGTGELQQVILDSNQFPKGWEKGIDVLIASTDPESAKGMGLVIQDLRFSGIEDPSLTWNYQSSIEAGTSSLTPDLPAFDNLESPFSFIYLKMVSSFRNETCCITENDRVPADPMCFPFPLDIAIRGAYYGIRKQQAVIDIQPLCTALYLGKYPYREYPWNQLKHQVQVIRSDRAKPSEWSRLPVSVRHLPGREWQSPHVAWTFGEENEKRWDDRFSSMGGGTSEYIAPSQEAWTDLNKPTLRPIRCRIGNGEEDEPVSERYPEIYRTKIIPTVVTLCEPVGKVKLRVDVRPKGFPTSREKLFLKDERVFDNISRSFLLEIDLQKIPARRDEK